jgi:hypothetical protein
MIGAAFIVVVLTVIVFGKHKPLSTSDVISLLTGAVTAIGLSAIFLQIQTNEKQRALEMAVRADQLHMEFNTRDMRQHRDIAYPYLKELRGNPEQLDALARYWIYDEEALCLTSENESGEASQLKFEDRATSVSVMVSFFVRLSSHIRFYDGRAKNLKAEDMANLIGPFFWRYWADAGIRAFVVKCAERHRLKASPFGTPYFISALDDLEGYSRRAGEAELKLCNLASGGEPPIPDEPRPASASSSPAVKGALEV